jgi:hypothetical protein
MHGDPSTSGPEVFAWPSTGTPGNCGTPVHRLSPGTGSSERSHPVWDREIDGPADDSRKDRSGWSLHRFCRTAGYSAGVGVILPLICLILDPLILKGGTEHSPIFREERVYLYSFFGLEILVLSLSLWRKEKLGRASGVAAGMLFSGAVAAAGFGLLLLPFSLLGLLVLIGILGFTPFLTAHAFVIQARLALGAVREGDARRYLPLSLALGVLLAFGLPYATARGVRREFRMALADVAAGDVSAVRRVRFWHGVLDGGGDPTPLDRAIQDERDPVRKERLSSCL